MLDYTSAGKVSVVLIKYSIDIDFSILSNNIKYIFQ
jgi:hypothetical protein